MKAYLITTGTVFGLIAVAHIWRVSQETHLARDPWFIVLTIVAVALSGWAWRLFSRLSRSRDE